MFNKNISVLLLFVNLICCINGLPASITYDERQTGDYNIRISVKDLKIIALLGEGIGALGDYDYNYDYSDMTVKPNESSTSTTTTQATTTKKENLLINFEQTTEKIVEITPAHSPILKPNVTLHQNTIKPDAVVNNVPKLNSTSDQKPNSTIFHIPTSSNFLEESVIAALQSPTIQTPIKNVIANFTSIFNELVESGSLGFKNNSESPTVNPGINANNIPVRVLLTPVEVHYHSEVNSTTSKPENSTVKRVRHGDCLEGYRKDKRGVCRPFLRRPTQPSLLKKLLQLSRRLQNNKKNEEKESQNTHYNKA